MKILKQKKSQCKLEKFNSCPGKENFENHFPLKLEYVDFTIDEKYQFLVNDEATVVFKYTKEMSEVSALELMQFMFNAHPDEFSIIDINDEKYIRMWWD